MGKKKSVIVTGGAGFIGSHLVDALIESGESVIVIDNLVGGHLRNLDQHKNQERLEFVDLNISTLNPSNSLFKDVSKVFHLAGIGDIIPSIEKPLEYFQNNVYGTANILDATRINNIGTFIYAASSSCYGIAKTPTDEKSSISCEHPYSLSKYLGEQLSFHMSKVYNLDVKSIRIFNAYGPRINTKGMYGTVFAVFLKQILENKPFMGHI
jgi:UDP-glucose 4-epimerase